MNEKLELLKELIEVSQLTIQLKINKIIQTLQLTEDSLMAKTLSNQILLGVFTDLQEKSIDNLITAFSNEDKKITTLITIKEDEVFDNNKEQNLEYQLRTIKLQLEMMENKNKKLEEVNNTLTESNNKLAARLYLTKNSKIIEVLDEDINELHIRHLENKETVAYGKAFIIDNIIPKTYYKIKE